MRLLIVSNTRKGSRRKLVRGRYGRVGRVLERSVGCLRSYTRLTRVKPEHAVTFTPAFSISSMTRFIPSESEA